ncbi:hypothetical protein N7539_003988 [Penicillium diatomitis]|uniref:Major facilitator superfamily (MFS) profile domain-containing protein n=1 Tax=Penicillium diatomitis TaxID=2819901 RepID=A0A9W9XDY2_9EURO|nr:uncharacterized protein N7539_003988 [Penicillium diatomitis]KAJ5489098.1 hypothetical protein N7539_003988 [Penicillium diatomitis]
MLPYMLEERMHQPPQQTQRLTSISLALHGIVSAFSGPILGHLADQTPSRKIPFLITLLGCIIGTLMVAFATSLGVFFAGRVLQGISGSGTWLIGLATVTDCVGTERIGVTLGVMTAVANSGTITGPMVSGFILELAGYWFTWSVPVVILVVDIVARMLMVENKKEQKMPVPTKSDSTTPSSSAHETEPLLQNSSTPAADAEQSKDGAISPSANVWRIMLGKSRVLTALLITVWAPALATSFNATLPLHVSDIFGWSPSRVGLMFMLLSLPSLPISPLAGHLRDRVGTRLPAAFGLVSQSVVLALLGFAGNPAYQWSSAGERGKALYVFCCVVFGFLRPLTSGVAPMELTLAVEVEEAKHPGVFGPQGGFSRAFSLIEVAVALGLTLGPVISGALTERFDYYVMCWTLSVLCVLTAVLAGTFLGSKTMTSEQSRPEVEAGNQH